MVSRRRLLGSASTLVGSVFAGCLGGSRTTPVSCDRGASAPDPANDRWPMVGYDPANRGYAPVAATGDDAPTPETVADVTVGAGGATFGDDTLYLALGDTSGLSGRLLALDAATDDTTWRVDLPRPVTGGPALDGDTVYLAAEGEGHVEATLHALERADGTERWQVELGGDSPIHPVVADGLVYAGRDDVQECRLFAFDAETGEKRWSFDAGDYLHGWPAVADGTAYVVCRDRELHALDADSGERQWVYGDREDRSLASAPTVADGLVFAGGGAGVVAVNACSGEHLWETSTDVASTQYGEGVFAGVSVADGTVYAPAVQDGPEVVARVMAMDAVDGDVRWETDLESPPPWLSKPAATDGDVYVGDRRGRSGVIAFDSEDGTVRWRTERGGDRPIAVDGTVYSAGQERMYRFSLPDSRE